MEQHGMGRILDGRLALVSGAGSGIGLGIAEGLGKVGARVVCVDIDGASAERAAKAIGGGAVGLACDVADAHACDELAAKVRKEIGPVSILVNNAGIMRRGMVDDVDAREKWKQTMCVNVDAIFSMTTAFLPQLKETKGCVVNTASMQSFIAMNNSAAYTTSKGAVRALTTSLAFELAPQGIRVNAIAPGIIATPINAVSRENPAKMEAFLSRIPMRRLGTPEDIAGPVIFLASPMADYITGVTLPIDGGHLTG